MDCPAIFPGSNIDALLFVTTSFWLHPSVGLNGQPIIEIWHGHTAVLIRIENAYVCNGADYRECGVILAEKKYSLHSIRASRGCAVIKVPITDLIVSVRNAQ